MARCGFSKLDFLPNTNWSAFYFFFPFPSLPPFSGYFLLFIGVLLKIFFWWSVLFQIVIEDRYDFQEECAVWKWWVLYHLVDQEAFLPLIWCILLRRSLISFFFLKFIFLVSIFFLRFLYLVPTLFIFVFSFSTFFFLSFIFFLFLWCCLFLDRLYSLH